MHLVHAMFELEESYAVYYMQLQGIEHAELLQQMTVLHEEAAAVRQTKDAYRDDEGTPRRRRRQRQKPCRRRCGSSLQSVSTMRWTA